MIYDMIKLFKKIINTWRKLDELDRRIHDVEKYLVDLNIKNVQTATSQQPVTFSDDRGEVWFSSKEEYIESRR
jgi:hypothetical protein